ncbi:helix-turn-helix domain-containing protein [Alteribacter populi]|uniref:helix-turn-helix domain-containing protein n=1 Tax=Alteribacter populi TaxID=2011011 RepID=UPI000BBA9B1A|nr:helix-turn-helix domain-containing protein [Alteribacter populi]
MELIGKRIREARAKNQLTQAQLANGICSQAQVSHIEKGALTPSAVVLYGISKKLGVDMNYFFNIGTDDKRQGNPTFKHIQSIVDNLKDLRDYKSLSLIIENAMVDMESKTSQEKQFLLWHKAICLYYVDNDFFSAERLLMEALALTDSQHLQVSEIENSYAIILAQEKKHEEALDLFHSCLQGSRRKGTISRDIEVKILFGLSQSLTHLELYSDSLFYSNQAITINIQRKSMYLLVECYYQSGFNLSQLNKYNDALEFLNNSSFIFNIQKNEKLVDIVEERIREIILFNNLQGVE